MEITKMDLFRILQGRKKGLLLTFIAFSIFANAATGDLSGRIESRDAT